MSGVGMPSVADLSDLAGLRAAVVRLEEAERRDRGASEAVVEGWCKMRERHCNRMALLPARTPAELLAKAQTGLEVVVDGQNPTGGEVRVLRSLLRDLRTLAGEAA